jgi:hypothetical protein
MSVDAKKVKDAALVFRAKMEAGELTDAQLRLKIKTLQAVLLERQQRRASAKDLRRRQGP